MSLESNKQLCRDYFTAFLARDTACWARHISPDFVRHDPGLPFEVRGPQAAEAVRQHLAGMGNRAAEDGLTEDDVSRLIDGE